MPNAYRLLLNHSLAHLIWPGMGWVCWDEVVNVQTRCNSAYIQSKCSTAATAWVLRRGPGVALRIQCARSSNDHLEATSTWPKPPTNSDGVYVLPWQEIIELNAGVLAA